MSSNALIRYGQSTFLKRSVDLDDELLSSNAQPDCVQATARCIYFEKVLLPSAINAKKLFNAASIGDDEIVRIDVHQNDMVLTTSLEEAIK